MSESFVQTRELCQAWCSLHIPGKPVPVPKLELSPNVHSEFPLTQLHATPASCHSRSCKQVAFKVNYD